MVMLVLDSVTMMVVLVLYSVTMMEVRQLNSYTDGSNHGRKCHRYGSTAVGGVS